MGIGIGIGFYLRDKVFKSSSEPTFKYDPPTKAACARLLDGGTAIETELHVLTGLTFEIHMVQPNLMDAEDRHNLIADLDAAIQNRLIPFLVGWVVHLPAMFNSLQRVINFGS